MYVCMYMQMLKVLTGMYALYTYIYYMYECMYNTLHKFTYIHTI